jgi:hypothetical protein
VAEWNDGGSGYGVLLERARGIRSENAILRDIEIVNEKLNAEFRSSPTIH